MKQVIKNIFSILSIPEKRKLVTLMILDIFVSILDIIFLIGLLYVINFYTQLPLLRTGPYYFPVFNEHPFLLISIFFLLFGIKNLFGFFVFKMQYEFVYQVASRISKNNLEDFLNGSYSNYVHVDSSVNIRKISQQPIEFCLYVLYGMQQVTGQLILIAITIAAILIYNVLLFPLLLLVLVPPVFLISFYMKSKLRSARLHGKTTSERSIQHLQEALSGFVESNIYQRNDFFSTRYYRLQSKLNHYLAEKQVIQNMPSRLIEVFAVFGLFMLVILNSFTGSRDSIQLATIGAFMAAAYKIIPGIVKVMNTWAQVKTYLFTIPGLTVHNNVVSGINKKDTISSIEFENIFFNYGDKKILEAFSLQAVKGDMIGIAGISGKGKTTIANLLLGFLTPVSGDILINGISRGDKERKAYWSRIAYIKQQPFFLYDSIRLNITLQETNQDAQKLSSVIRTTGIDRLIGSSTNGLETIITENGKNFSGGQRQRMIFARTLYKDADLLILDEPFNELDEASETAMLQELQKLAAEGKIIILITHNRHALSFCNKQILLNER